jgi:hypothetical protein
MRQKPLVGQGLLIFDVSRSHSDRSNRLGLFWTSNRPEAETSTSAHNTYKRQASIPPSGFKLAIPASERPQTHALDCAATGIGQKIMYKTQIHCVGKIQIFIKLSLCLEFQYKSLFIIYNPMRTNSTTTLYLLAIYEPVQLHSNAQN